MNFLTDLAEGRSTLRPADVLVFGWERGKHACVDLTGVSPLVGLRDSGFVAGQAVAKAEKKKMEKDEQACDENQHAFIPFAFDTFGSLAPAGCGDRNTPLDSAARRPPDGECSRLSAASGGAVCLTDSVKQKLAPCPSCDSTHALPP